MKLAEDLAKVQESGEAVAHGLADANRVELAWCLRGALDALADLTGNSDHFATGSHDAGEYAGSYRRGYRGIQG